MIAWIFDVDGVITSPTEKEIIESELIPELINRLKKGEPVAIVSGRAMSWINRVVIEKIKSQVEDQNLLNNLFISAEFGGITTQYLNSEEKTTIDHDDEIPPQIVEESTKLISEEFSDIAFVDKEKQIQFTAEMQKGITVEDFKQKQKVFSASLEAIVEKFDHSGNLEVHVDRIATNIKNRNLNKHFAVKAVLKWLSDRNISPDQFQVFGDSKTDLEMGRELQSSGKHIKFIYVGDEEIDDEEFDVVKQGNVDKGTLDYLRNI